MCLAAILGFSGCGGRQAGGQPDTDDTGKVRISVTFNAMKEFAKAVGGDKVEISTVIPDGIELHDFEPKAQDLAGLSTAHIFVYNGFGIEAWVENAIASAGSEDLIVVEASSGVTPIVNTGGEEMEEHGQYDPHVWLGLKGAAAGAENIRDALVKADPSNKEYYEANCRIFVSELEDLWKEYNQKFLTVRKKSLVTGHAAFAYLCRDFGLNQNSVEDVFAEGEPSARQLAALVEYCRQNHVTTVFSEESASPEISKTLASEVGASVETIYTAESTEDGKSYLERMEDNLRKIYESLSE